MQRTQEQCRYLFYYQFLCLRPLTSPHAASPSVGGDHRRRPLPVHRHGDPLPALPVPLSLLGGLLSLLRVSAAHHVPGEPTGALLKHARSLDCPRAEKRRPRGCTAPPPRRPCPSTETPRAGRREDGMQVARELQHGSQNDHGTIFTATPDF